MINRKAIFLFLLAGTVLLLGVGVNFFFVKEASPDNIVFAITKNLAKEIEVLDAEANRLIASQEDAEWNRVSHSFFLMDSSTVLRWNQNKYLPDPSLLQGDFKIKSLQDSRGSFIIKKWKHIDHQYLLAVLPVYEKYAITNRYLVPAWNPRILSSSNAEILDVTSDEGYPIIGEGSILFKIQFSPISLWQYSVKNTSVLLFGSASLLLFSIGLYFLTKRLHFLKKYALTFFVLLIGMILLRVIMTLFNFPSAFSSLFIFDPLIFASSSLNPSIADLFFNTVAVLILAGYFFYTYYRWAWIKKMNMLNPVIKFGFAVIALLIGFSSILFPFLFFETISHNSTISLDITQSINFHFIRILAFLSIILGSVATFLFSHSFFKIALIFTDRSRLYFYAALLTATILFFFYYIISERDYLITTLIAFVYFLLLFESGLHAHLKRFSYFTFLYFFLIIVSLSIQGSFSIEKFVEEKTKEDQLRYGNNFLVGRDIFGEYLLNEAVLRIKKDPYIQSRMAIPFLTKSGVRQKINQVYLNTYFDRYDVQVQLYSASGESYDNRARVDFASLINSFQQDANKTPYAGIYFIENTTQESAKRYLAILQIEQPNPVGFIVIDLSLKKLIPQNVFPELLVDNQFINYFKNSEFSYAFLQNGKLISNAGNYNYERDFDPKLLENVNIYKNGLEMEGFRHIAIEDDLGKVAIVTAAHYPKFSLLANFSFLFVLGFCFVIVLLILYTYVLWMKGEQLNYAARIQVYIYLAFLLPLIAVSVTTLNLISNSAEKDLDTEFLIKSKLLGDKLGISMDLYLQSETNLKSEFENQLRNLTNLANIDASVFSLDGKLMASSQPLIYQNQLTSNLIDWDARARIVYRKEISVIQNDAIGKLNFNTAYVSLKSANTGVPIGILSIPFFDSANSLEKTQINVWANILAIFVIIFLLFSLVSFFIVNWLTFPLQFITRTLSKTSFSGENVPLTWKSNDEIGLLVSEYNKMLENLERSKMQLSRSQKESAWREIAKQIAHEINNPLTPMKLTLQRMEQAQAKGELTKENTDKSLQTLLTQVDILGQIASSFSAFARMPAPVLQKADIYNVLTKVVDLHVNYASATIHLLYSDSIFILGDELLLTRIFSNMLLNSLQSVEEGREIKIDITTKMDVGFCLVSITDNGNGIAAELKDKVFLPQFSTKKSGSGIGLAIAKQGIELSGGTIWFESEAGLGTTFYVKLPLYF